MRNGDSVAKNWFTEQFSNHLPDYHYGALQSYSILNEFHLYQNLKRQEITRVIPYDNNIFPKNFWYDINYIHCYSNVRDEAVFGVCINYNYPNGRFTGMDLYFFGKIYQYNRIIRGIFTSRVSGYGSF